MEKLEKRIRNRKEELEDIKAALSDLEDLINGLEFD